MNRLVRFLRGALGLGISYAVIWALFGLSVGFLVLALDPASIDQGEDPITLAGILGTVGFVTGAVFAMVLAYAERQKNVSDLSLWRMAFWGGLAGLAMPLLTTMNDQVIFNTVPLGALSAALTVALARRGAQREPAIAPVPRA